MSQDPVPDEELPPRLRFERMVNPESQVVGSSLPDLGGEEPPESVLDRFETLKKRLGEAPRPANEPGEEPSQAAVTPEAMKWPAPTADDADDLSAIDSSLLDIAEQQNLDGLDARIQEERRKELEIADQPLPEETVPGLDEEVDKEQPLTYEELEAAKMAEAKQRKRAAAKARRRQKRKGRSFWKELPILILVALVVAIVIKTFFFQAFYIPSGSMVPSLEINDRVLVNKLSYQFGAIERGDILVFDSPEAVDVRRSLVEKVFRTVGEATGLVSPDTVLIKRVIGLPGETVEIREGQLFVDDNPISEPYLAPGVTMRDMDVLLVPADHVFLMGDNRNQSRDRRVFGPIHRDDIVGRAFVTVWPPGRWGGL